MICVATGAETLRIAAVAFTLSWTHSVEKVAWSESWAVDPAGLSLLEASVKGSGAGMEPPPGAVLRDGAWRYRPDLAPIPELVLAASGATGAGWTICAAGRCREIGASAQAPVIVRPCESH